MKHEYLLKNLKFIQTICNKFINSFTYCKASQAGNLKLWITEINHMNEFYFPRVFAHCKNRDKQNEDVESDVSIGRRVKYTEKNEEISLQNVSNNILLNSFVSYKSHTFITRHGIYQLNEESSFSGIDNKVAYSTHSFGLKWDLHGFKKGLIRTLLEKSSCQCDLSRHTSGKDKSTEHQVVSNALTSPLNEEDEVKNRKPNIKKAKTKESVTKKRTKVICGRGKPSITCLDLCCTSRTIKSPKLKKKKASPPSLVIGCHGCSGFCVKLCNLFNKHKKCKVISRYKIKPHKPKFSKKRKSKAKRKPKYREKGTDKNAGYPKNVKICECKRTASCLDLWKYDYLIKLPEKKMEAKKGKIGKRKKNKRGGKRKKNKRRDEKHLGIKCGRGFCKPKIICGRKKGEKIFVKCRRRRKKQHLPIGNCSAIKRYMNERRKRSLKEE